MFNFELVIAAKHSIQIKWAVNILTVLILLLHSTNYFYGAGLPKYKTIFFIQDFISNGLCRVAVPLFFCISGFLYFHDISQDFGWKSYISKIKKRFFTLVIPYFFWTILWVMVYFLMVQFHQLKALVNNVFINDFNVVNFFKLIYYLPIPYHLWFIRDLFLIGLISPIIFALNKYTKGIWLIFYIPVLVYKQIFLISIFVLTELPYMTIFFFSIGSLIALNYERVLKLKFSANYLVLLIPLWLLAIYLKTEEFWYLKSNVVYYSIKYNILDLVTNVIGIITFWKLLQLIVREDVRIKKEFLNYSFAIYVLHEPFMSIIKKLIFKMNSEPSLPFIIYSYFLLPVFVVIACFFAAKFLTKYVPRLYTFIFGNR